MSSPPFPSTPRVGQVDEYHGEQVPDPYRWLEDANDPATRTWVQAQNAVTEAFLSAVPSRQRLRTRQREAWDYPRAGVPFSRGESWFEERNSGLQDHDVLYLVPSPGEPGRVLLDPNTLSEDGTVSVPQFSVSPGGKLLAYATSGAGSDWMTWHVRDVVSREDLPDLLCWSKFGRAAWASDESGFYYPKAEEPPPGRELTASAGLVRIMYHRLGTAQEDDLVVFEAPEHPEWMPEGRVTEDGRYLVITVTVGTAPETRVELVDLQRPGDEGAVLVEGFSCRAEVVCNVDGTFWLLTDAGAERGRLVRARVGVRTRVGAPSPQDWEQVVAEADDILVGAANCGGRLVCHYLRDACSAVRAYDLDGGLVDEVALPPFSSLSQAYSSAGVEGRQGAGTAYFKVVSFASPGTIWSYEVASGAVVLVEDLAGGPGAPAPDLVTEQAMVQVEGVGSVPMFLTHRTDVVPDGNVPVLLYGYGGFNIPLTPAYSPWMALFARLGGLLAVAVLPGGGEYGRSWYEAGRLGTKQQVFDSFCECARWLATSGWSRASRIAANGASNGGLLVGACLVQHPELFGAAVAEVGVLDMLRYHLFTIGWAWKSDYGDPADPEQYSWLRAYSPLHNVRQGAEYPPVMVVTADHDDRVVPGHSLKFAATLQHACRGREGAAPVLLRVEVSAGHGHGAPTTKLIDERADVLAFLDWAVGPLERGR